MLHPSNIDQSYVKLRPLKHRKQVLESLDVLHYTVLWRNLLKLWCVIQERSLFRWKMYQVVILCTNWQESIMTFSESWFQLQHLQVRHMTMFGANAIVSIVPPGLSVSFSMLFCQLQQPHHGVLPWSGKYQEVWQSCWWIYARPSNCNLFSWLFCFLMTNLLFPIEMYKLFITPYLRPIPT